MTGFLSTMTGWGVSRTGGIGRFGGTRPSGGPADGGSGARLRWGFGASGSGDVVAEAGDAGQQPLVLQGAQRFGARLPRMPVLLAQCGDGRRGHPRGEGPLG